MDAAKGTNLIITNPAPKRSKQTQIVSLLTKQTLIAEHPESQAWMEESSKRIGNHQMQ
jgi:hypothetical protein